MPQYKKKCDNCTRKSKAGEKCSFCKRSVSKPAKVVKGAEFLNDKPPPEKGPKPAQGGKDTAETQEGKDKGKAK